MVVDSFKAWLWKKVTADPPFSPPSSKALLKAITSSVHTCTASLLHAQLSCHRSLTYSSAIIWALHKLVQAMWLSFLLVLYQLHTYWVARIKDSFKNSKIDSFLIMTAIHVMSFFLPQFPNITSVGQLHKEQHSHKTTYSSDSLKRLHYPGVFKNKVILYVIMLFLKKFHTLNEDKNVVPM